jgi:protein PhnA
MWSEHTAVQVVAWENVKPFACSFGWPQELDQMYLDEDTLAWAQATGEGEEDETKVIHRDSNGVILETGDSVVLIKDLK